MSSLDFSHDCFPFDTTCRLFLSFVRNKTWQWTCAIDPAGHWMDIVDRRNTGKLTLKYQGGY